MRAVERGVNAVCRLAAGSVFAVSGLVKAIDPAGMGLKINAYLAAWGNPLPLGSLLLEAGAATLAVVEFMLGIYLLLGIRRRLTRVGLLAFMIAATALSLYLVRTEAVADCGCFGEAWPLTPRETLAKNLALLACAVILAVRPRRPKRLISERNQWCVSMYSLFYITGLCLYSFHYLPVVDFTAYRIGTDLRRAASGADGASDAVFWLTDADTGEDVTDSILFTKGKTMLLTLPDIAEADDGCADRINDLRDYCADKGVGFYAVTCEGRERREQWTDRTGTACRYLLTDCETLEAMVRSNPGLLLLEDGVVAGKWSNNNLTETPRSIPQKQAGGWWVLSAWYFVPLGVFILADSLWIGSLYRRRRKLRKYFTNLNHKKRKTMRKKIVAGNWKMNKNLQEGIALAEELVEALKNEKPNCDVVICTPFIHLASVAKTLEGSVVGLGAENCADKASGAYTGEVSAEMVKSTGANYLILGHSERREYYHETPEILREKVQLAQANGLTVIFCIGESLAEREAGKQNEVVKTQLEGSVFNLSAEDFGKLIIAYEPIWAIGTGKTATSEQAEEIHAYIRSVIAEKYGQTVADETSILYGGSCKASNAPELFAKPDIDGGLIGGASLKAADFKGIIDAWN